MTKKASKARKQTTFQVGDRVARNDIDIDCAGGAPNEPDFGTIVEVVSDTQVRVLWDWQKPYANQPTGEPNLFEVADLITETKAQKEFASLEKEWHKFSKPLIAKMEQAAKLIREVNKKVQKEGFDLNEMYDLTDPLEQAMEDSGWNTSSWNC